MNFRRIALPVAGGLVGITALASAFTPVVSKIMPVSSVTAGAGAGGGASAVVTTPPVTLPNVPLPSTSPAVSFAKNTVAGAQGIAGNAVAGAQNLVNSTLAGAQGYAGSTAAGAQNLVGGLVNTVQSTVNGLPQTVQGLLSNTLSAGLGAAVNGTASTQVMP